MSMFDRKKFGHDKGDGDDSFGPGSDLILSLVAILLIIIVIIVYISKYQNGIAMEDYELLKKDKESIEKENSRLKVKIARTEENQKESNYLLRVCESERIECNDNISIIKSKHREVNSLLNDKDSEMLRLNEVISRLKKELDEKVNRLNYFQRESDHIGNIVQEKNLEIESLHEKIQKMEGEEVFKISNTDVDGETPFFFKNRDDLTPQGKSFIDENVMMVKAALKSRNTNNIMIQGYASAECMKDQGVCRKVDGNLGLSARRSASVAHYLNEKGVDYTCMTVVGFGRSRSSIIDNENVSIFEWDELSDRGISEYSLESERVVKITAIYDRNSLCKIPF